MRAFFLLDCCGVADGLIASRLAPTGDLMWPHYFMNTINHLWEILWLRESPQLAFG